MGGAGVVAAALGVGFVAFQRMRLLGRSAPGLRAQSFEHRGEIVGRGDQLEDLQVGEALFQAPLLFDPAAKLLVVDPFPCGQPRRALAIEDLPTAEQAVEVVPEIAAELDRRGPRAVDLVQDRFAGLPAAPESRDGLGVLLALV